jgi:nanoRNase/pAp phosphatase (c-di-AMP/oligoRNAs hydrolase)
MPLVNQRKLSHIEVPSLDAAHYASLIRGIVNARLYGELIFADLDAVTSIDEIAQTADLLIRNAGTVYSVVMGTFDENLYVSVRTSLSKRSSESIIRKIVGRRGDSGGHGRAAGGKISLKGQSEEEQKALRQAMYKKIFDTFSKKENEFKFLVPPSTFDYLSRANIPELPTKSEDKEVHEKIGML